VPELDPGTIVRVLNKHGVQYVIIGGIAAEIHDLPVPATVDIDVTPARDHKNLERLARAFDELEAGLYTAEEAGTWFPRMPVELWSRYDTLHLMTKAGPRRTGPRARDGHHRGQVGGAEASDGPRQGPRTPRPLLRGPPPRAERSLCNTVRSDGSVTC
jgi:hypothetical protein